MSAATLRSFVLVVAALLMAMPSAAAQGSGSGLPPRSLLDRFGLELTWTNQATIDIHSDIVEYFVADEDVVVIQSRSGLLTVFDAETGRRLWDGHLAVPNQHSFPPATNADYLFVVIGSTAYCRDKRTGGEIWTLRLPGPPSSPPAVDSDEVFFGLMNGGLYAYKLERLAYLQGRGLLPEYRWDALVWKVNTSEPIYGTPVTDERVVGFVNEMGVLYAFDTEFRSLEFAFESRQPPTAPLAIGHGEEEGRKMHYIYLAAGDNSFFCIRTTNGTTRWSYVTGRVIRNTPAVIDDDVFITPIESGFYNLAAENGAEQWWSPFIKRFIAASPTRVYGTDPAGNMAILKRKNGALIGTIPLQDFPIRVQNELTDRIFVATSSGLVACFREKDIEQPIYHAHPERRPIIPIFPGEEVIKAPAVDDGGRQDAQQPPQGNQAPQAPAGTPQEQEGESPFAPADEGDSPFTPAN